jgi:hypothetical protein
MDVLVSEGGPRDGFAERKTVHADHRQDALNSAVAAARQAKGTT